LLITINWFAKSYLPITDQQCHVTDDSYPLCFSAFAWATGMASGAAIVTRTTDKALFQVQRHPRGVVPALSATW